MGAARKRSTTYYIPTALFLISIYSCYYNWASSSCVKNLVEIKEKDLMEESLKKAINSKKEAEELAEKAVEEKDFLEGLLKKAVKAKKEAEEKVKLSKNEMESMEEAAEAFLIKEKEINQKLLKKAMEGKKGAEEEAKEVMVEIELMEKLLNDTIKLKENAEEAAKAAMEENEMLKDPYLQEPYNQHDILYLNQSTAYLLKQKQPSTVISQQNDTKFYIDILTIGSVNVNSIERATTQMKTWGSHISRRHFWLATEFDDLDPDCHTKLTREDMIKLSETCKQRGEIFWHGRGAFNKNTAEWKRNFARYQWLFGKPNPAGWVCAQKRFVVALSKLMVIYREGRDKYGIELPDYLIFGDDDTYINMEMMEDELLRKPNKVVQEKQMSLEDELTMVFPTQNTPVVWAGCRVRRPVTMINSTFPFGGFGVLFSKAAMERLMQPLYCKNTTVSSGFEWEACEHFTPAYQKLWSISEQEYFEDGMSVSDLMGSYATNLEPFCLHSDWAIGYFVNHFNISRHTVPTGYTHPGMENDVPYLYNDQMANVEHSRLHAWDDGSEIYLRDQNGNCKNEGKKCNEEKSACHQMTSEMMQNVHNAVRLKFPDKYNQLEEE